MKKLLTYLILLIVFAGCRSDYAKQDFVGDWKFNDGENEFSYITFTQDSIYTFNEYEGSTKKYAFKISNDSILMLTNMNGIEKLADWGKIYKVSKSELILGDNHFEVSLKRTDDTKVER